MKPASETAHEAHAGNQRMVLLAGPAAPLLAHGPGYALAPDRHGAAR